VAAVVTGLVALLVAFFGLQGSAGPLAGHASAARVAGFGAGMVAFLILGILARTGGWLQPSISQRVEAYRTAGYPDPVALDVALYEHVGLLSGGLKGVTAPAGPTQGSGILFSDGADPNCSALAGDRFARAGDRAEAMRQTGGAWAAVGTVAAGLDPAEGASLTAAAWELACRPRG
jgi:hypothetical protein